MADDLARLRHAPGDRHEIERQVGSGGVATVFLARDRRHDRRDFLKVSRPELAAALATARARHDAVPDRTMPVAAPSRPRP